VRILYFWEHRTLPNIILKLRLVYKLLALLYLERRILSLALESRPIFVPSAGRGVLNAFVRFVVEHLLVLVVEIMDRFEFVSFVM
jgi:hypothetical protein